RLESHDESCPRTSVMTVQQCHVGKFAQSPTNLTLQKNPARVVLFAARSQVRHMTGLDELMPAERHPPLGQIAVRINRAASGHVAVRESGKELVEDLRSTHPEGVGLASLRHATPLSVTGGEHIALDNRDSSVEVREHPGGKETAHAGPENNRVLTDARHDD